MDLLTWRCEVNSSFKFKYMKVNTTYIIFLEKKQKVMILNKAYSYVENRVQRKYHTDYFRREINSLLIVYIHNKIK
jgi:hypothetical protein